MKVVGTVLTANQEPIEFATVLLLEPGQTSSQDGTTTDVDGKFELATKLREFDVEISFIGFETQRIEGVKMADRLVDLGVVTLSGNENVLEEVVVSGEKSTMEFRLDKRVFNVGKDLSSTGASALEVLNNVPSVTVNIEGQINLRGSGGVQVLINGKPSVLASEEGNALGSITADMIEKIEVITNPSAKYEAEGSSGIINIVLKKEEKKGMNGSVTLNTGIPDNHSIGLSLNRRTEKFNLFSQLGAGYRSLPRDNENINQNFQTGTVIRSSGEEFRNEQFYNVILGTDYHINDLNVITLSGNFAYEIEDQPSETQFQLLDNDEVINSDWQRIEETSATNPKWQYDLQYKKEFPDNKDHTLLFSTLGNFFGKDLTSTFNNTTIFGNRDNETQETRTNFGEERYTFKLDYTRPLSDEVTIETGAQYVYNFVSNDFQVSDLINGEFIANPDFSNIFEWEQGVLGVYGTGSYEGDRWGVKAGLRMEQTDLNTLLVTTDEANQQNFVNFFPSLSSSFKATERVSLQASYSRRIFRPRLWDLNPFFNIRNNFNIWAGNPNLQPQFTDSYEFTSIYVGDDWSANLGAYHRYTTDVVERIVTFEDNVSFTRPENIGTDATTGAEFNFKYSPLRWLSFNGDFNYNFFQQRGSFNNQNFDFDADKWTGRLISKIKLPQSIDAEITYDYRSGFRNFQSEISPNYAINIGLRKKLMKGRMIVSFSVRDLFKTRIRETITDQPEFYVYSRSFRGRFFTLGVSYGFGKGEAMEFSGSRRR